MKRRDLKRKLWGIRVTTVGWLCQDGGDNVAFDDSALAEDLCLQCTLDAGERHPDYAVRYEVVEYTGGIDGEEPGINPREDFWPLKSLPTRELGRLAIRCQLELDARNVPWSPQLHQNQVLTDATWALGGLEQADEVYPPLPPDATWALGGLEQADEVYPPLPPDATWALGGLEQADEVYPPLPPICNTCGKRLAPPHGPTDCGKTTER